MIKIACTSCGASDLYEADGFRICRYCGSRYKIQEAVGITLNDDVARLLEKCKTDPAHAKKYANLILDIDPTNATALRILGL